MFETAELGSQISKREYKVRMPEVRRSLLEAQQALRTSSAAPVIVVIGGLETAGRSETANLLNEWMDPRWIVTRAWERPSDEEAERPPFWRYWRELPPRGRIGLFLSAWYGPPLRQRVAREMRKAQFERMLGRISTFERELGDDGATIIKFFLYLDAESQRSRIETLDRNPLTRWRVSEEQWESLRNHARIKRFAEQMMRRTSTGAAPWHIVEGADERYRALTVATLLRDAIERNLARAAELPPRHAPPQPGSGHVDDAPVASDLPIQRFNVLRALDLTRSLSRKRYPVTLEKQQGRLNQLQRQARERGVTTIAVFEGWDASGKGGAIRRVTAALDARDYEVIPIAAPTDEERAHHYLWRFWRHLARGGRVTIFDRSWYGRVLVERVEQLVPGEVCRRAYGEINHFEDQLVEHGIVLTKFWLHISKAEQLQRFRDRERQPLKQWKITAEDWRNRRKWTQYEVAANEMVARTSTRRAPWVLVEANDKQYARVKVIRTLADRLARTLDR